MANTVAFNDMAYLAWVFGYWIPASYPPDVPYYWQVSDDEADTNWADGSAGDGTETPGELLQANGAQMVFWSTVEVGGKVGMLLRYPGDGEGFYLLGIDDDTLLSTGGWVDILLTNLGLSGDDASINSVSYTYPVNFTGGSGNDYWAGNGFANIANGAGGDDTITGMGGNDSLLGGDGNDSLDGGDANDTLSGAAGRDVLNGGAGDDSLLGGGSNDIITGGDGNDYLDGGNSGDKLYGNAGRDTLHGGASNDTLAGAGGRDVFLFDADLAANGIDTITDFLVGMDKVYVAVGVSGLGYTGELNAANFVSGSAATTSDQHFIYDSGNLYYDADGSGAGAQVQFATFSNAAVLSASDIVIV